MRIDADFVSINFYRLAEKRMVMEEKKYENGCCQKSNTKKPIKGIDCDVKSCAYHDGVKDCCASKISVGPSDAKCSSGTACATFKPREY